MTAIARFFSIVCVGVVSAVFYATDFFLEQRWVDEVVSLLAVLTQILLHVALVAAHGTLKVLSARVNNLVSNEMMFGEKLLVAHVALNRAFLVNAHVL